MEKTKLEKLLSEHLLTDDPNVVEAYKNNPPQIIEKLQWECGEGIISELDNKDLIQLLSRYLNNDGVYVKNILHLLLRIEKLLTFIAKKSGVDVDKEFKDDAKKQAEILKIRESTKESK